MSHLFAHSRGGGRKPGFTLIELLVVLAIIAVLISLLLPAIGAAKDAAKAAVCLSQKRQVGIAFSSYSNDAQQTIPGAACRKQSGSSGTSPWYTFINGSHASDLGYTHGDEYIDPDVPLRCPNNVDGTSWGRGYGAYYSVDHKNNRDGAWWFEDHSWYSGQFRGIRLQNVAEATNILYLACTSQEKHVGRGVTEFWHRVGGNNPTGKGLWLAHYAGTAGLFLDTHAEMINEQGLGEIDNAHYYDESSKGIIEWWSLRGEHIYGP